MRVAVIGVGAIGGLIAGHLAENGIDITAVTKHSDLAATVRTSGLKLQGKEKPRSIPIKAVSLITDLEGKFDVIFLAMKATGVMEAVKTAIPFLKDEGAVVTLQNGLVEDDVAKIAGKERVAGAVVVFASTMIKPGVIERTSDGSFVMGWIDRKGNQERLNEITRLLEYCQPVTITDNIYGARYTKLAINAAINGLGAVGGLTIGGLVTDSRTRRLFMGTVTETVAVADKSGIELPKMGAFHPRDIVLTGSDTPATLEKKEQVLIDVFSPYTAVKTSTLQSLERGQLSEIDYLNGYIARKGKELGIQAPINAKITQLVKEIESGKRKIIPDNLLELPLP